MPEIGDHQGPSKARQETCIRGIAVLRATVIVGLRVRSLREDGIAADDWRSADRFRESPGRLSLACVRDRSDHAGVHVSALAGPGRWGLLMRPGRRGRAWELIFSSALV